MTLFIFLTGICIVVFALIYDFLRSNIQSKLASVKKKELNELQETEQHLREQLHTLQSELSHTDIDPVTHLLNWRLFENRFNQYIKESERHHLAMAFMFIDIDEFKVINDALGYEVGNFLLLEIAQRLTSCIRQVDSLSRFTKDTFAILLPQLSKPATAALVAQRVLQSLAEPFQIKQEELYITVGIGISIYPADGANASDLMRSADQALHLAKVKGKHNYQFYRETDYLNSHRELTLATSLRRESVFEDFIIYYQPIRNVQNKTVFCMDALLHWQHAELGLIDQQELFNCAEKQNKLNIFSEWLLQRACQQFLHWRTLGFHPTCLGISLSIKQLESSHFIYNISQILQKLEFKPEWLLLEIKTGTPQISFDVLEKTFNMLKYLGVKLAIDHFGSGLFPLYQLKNFTLHYLKLDPLLIENIEHHPQAVTLIQSIIGLAENMSMELIIQGVDSAEQVSLLKALGCALMQGPFLSAPLLENEIESKMVTPLLS